MGVLFARRVLQGMKLRFSNKYIEKIETWILYNVEKFFNESKHTCEILESENDDMLLEINPICVEQQTVWTTHLGLIS